MAVFPRIQSPCPYKNELAQLMDGDVCRMCKRQVVDITGMSDAGRVAFLKGCETEVCVSYSLPVRVAAAAALAVSLGMPMAAAAQDAGNAAVVAAVEQLPGDETIDMIVVGGIKTPAEAKMVRVDDPADQATPLLPVAYEDTPQDAQPTPAGPSVKAPAAP